MDLTLNVTRKDGAIILSVIKKLCKLHCRIDADFKNGLIRIKDLNDNLVDECLDTINDVFEIDRIQIIPADDYEVKENQSENVLIQEPDDDYTGEDSFSDGEAAQEPADDYEGEEEQSENVLVQEPADDYEGEENQSESVGNYEDTVAFEEFFKDAFADNLAIINENGTLEKRIYDFFEAIDFCQHDIVITMFIRLFLSAFEVTEITYDSIVLSMRKKYGDFYNVSDIKVISRNKFSEWLENHPIFKQKYPDCSIIDLIKFFVKFSYK